MDTTTTIADPIELVRRLDPDAIERRIDDLDRERAALITLLRAARRVRPIHGVRPIPAAEVAHA